MPLEKVKKERKREMGGGRERERDLSFVADLCVLRYGIPSSFDIILHSSRHDKPRIRASIKSGST